TFLLKRLGFAAKEQAMEAYENTGLHPYHYAIMLVLDEGSRETQGSIADALGYDRGQLVGLLDALHQHAPLEPRPHPNAARPPTRHPHRRGPRPPPAGPPARAPDGGRSPPPPKRPGAPRPARPPPPPRQKARPPLRPQRPPQPRLGATAAPIVSSSPIIRL